jgi:DNA-directed RNA polymerase sigma subunit (sigma70/sigma32)
MCSSTRVRQHDIDLSKVDADVLARADLTPRQRAIYEARFLTDPPLSLRVLAAEFNVSRNRVHQMETVLITKLRRALCSWSD